MTENTYKVTLKGAYNDFRIVEANSRLEARELVEKTNNQQVDKVELRQEYI